DIDRLIGGELPAVIAGADDGIRVIGLGLAGRLDEARHRLTEMRSASRIPVFTFWIEYLDAWLDRRTAEMLVAREAFTKLKIRDDPEVVFQYGWMMCHVGEYESGVDHLRCAVDKGYYVAPTLSSSGSFDAVRSNPTFRAVLADAEEGRRRALAAFVAGGGDRRSGPVENGR